MSHADTADNLLIKPTAGARPASPRTLGRFIRKARIHGLTPDESRTPRTTPRLATAPDGPTKRVSQTPEEDLGSRTGRSLIGMARWTLVSASFSLLLVCSLVSAASAVAVVTSRAGIWRGGKAGLTISYPAGWHVTTRRLTTITQPTQRFLVYSGAMPGSLAQVASPRANQALAIVMEETSVSASDLKHFPRRPKRFTVSHLGGVESFAGWRWAERVFRENGRAFYVFLWVGANDNRQLPTLLDTLDSLRVA